MEFFRMMWIAIGFSKEDRSTRRERTVMVSDIHAENMIVLDKEFESETVTFEYGE